MVNEAIKPSDPDVIYFPNPEVVNREPERKKQTQRIYQGTTNIHVFRFEDVVIEIDPQT